MKNKTIIIGGLAFLGVGGLAYALSTKKSTGKAEGALLADTNSTSLATVSTTTTSSGSTETGTTTSVVVPPAVNNSPFVEYPDGYKIYDINGNVIDTPLMVTLSGDNKNLLTATTNFVSNARQLCYAIDFGDHLSSGNNVGWKAGLPNQLELPADGRVHSLIVGLIGDVWGSDPNTNKMTHLFQMFFRVGGTMNLVGAIQYPSTFQPTNSKLPSFFDQIPSFTLPTKLNHYAGTIPKNHELFNFEQRGFAAWELTANALAIYPNSKNYQTHYDGVFHSSGWQSAAGMNASNQAFVQSLASQFVLADAPIGKGIHVIDDEWRQGVNFDDNGKLMRKYFFERAKGICPETHFFCHHQAPFTNKIGFFDGSMALQELARPFRADYQIDNLINDYVNHSFHSQDWADIAGHQRGDNAGQYLDISVSAYVSMYNPAMNVYAIAQSLFINKKFYSNKKVIAVIEGSTEVSVSQQEGVHVAWQFQNGGEHEVLNPMLPTSYCETIALLSNFIADGINCWDEGAIEQEGHPAEFYAFHSQIGIPEGNTVNGMPNGRFAKQYKGVYNYVVAGMYKYSRIPETAKSTVFIPDISLDGGTTWLSGDDVAPSSLAYRKQPMAFAMQNGGVTSVVVSYPFNKPTRKYDFRVRVNGVVIPVSVCGQYPEIFTI